MNMKIKSVRSFGLLALALFSVGAASAFAEPAHDATGQAACDKNNAGEHVSTSTTTGSDGKVASVYVGCKKGEKVTQIKIARTIASGGLTTTTTLPTSRLPVTRAVAPMKRR